MQNYKLIHLSSDYAYAVRALNDLVASMEAMEAMGNAYAGQRAEAFRTALRVIEPMGAHLEDVPTWQDINDSLRAGA